MIRLIPSISLALAFLWACPNTLPGAQLRVVSIGISGYPNYPDSPLKYAHLDAVAFASVFQQVEGGDPVKFLPNKEASREAILDALTGLQGTAPDMLLVFFSGHAELDPASPLHLYLMPYEGDGSRPVATGLAISEFLDQVREVGAKHTVIFLDACHAGAAIGSKGSTANPTAKNLAEEAFRKNQELGSTFVIFTSASGTEVSSEDDEFHQGIFTHFLVQGLRGTASPDPHHGQVTAGDLKQYLDREISRRVTTLGKPTQTVLVSPGYDSRLVLIPSRAPATASTENGPAEYSVPSQENAALARDPELNLMIAVSSAQLNRGRRTLQDLSVGPILHALAIYRSPKAKSINRIHQLDSSICSTLSSDGSVFVSLVKPTELHVVDLHGAMQRTVVPIGAPSNSASDLQLDSCTISVSGDNQFAALATRSLRGRVKTVAIGLGSEPEPRLPDTEFGEVAFGSGFLALARRNQLHFLETKGWTEVFNVEVSGLGAVRQILSDPQSTILGVTGDNERTQIFNVDLVS